MDESEFFTDCCPLFLVVLSRKVEQILLLSQALIQTIDLFLELIHSSLVFALLSESLLPLLDNNLNPGLGVRDPPIVVLQLLAHLLELAFACLQLCLSLVGV